MGINKPNTTEVARKAFTTILKAFPDLKYVENKSGPVELSYDLPVQEGLKYSINLNLQNDDELHFSVEHFWVSWFPCTNEDRVASFIDVVKSFISAETFVLEHCRGKECFKSQLVKRVDDSLNILLTFSSCIWPKTADRYRVVQNVRH